jgi:hypothetical protein
LIEIEKFIIRKTIGCVKANHQYGEEHKIACCPNIRILEIYGNKDLINECFIRLEDFGNEFQDYLLNQ